MILKESPMGKYGPVGHAVVVLGPQSLSARAQNAIHKVGFCWNWYIWENCHVARTLMSRTNPNADTVGTGHNNYIVAHCSSLTRVWTDCYGVSM